MTFTYSVEEPHLELLAPVGGDPVGPGRGP